MKYKYLILAAGISLAGCVKKAKDNINKMHGVKWSGTYAVPIINADLSLDDAVALAGDFVGVQPYNDGLLYMEYKNKIVSKYGYEMIQLANQIHANTDQLSGTEKSTLTSAGSVSASRDFSNVYDAGTLEFDSIHLSGGKLRVQFTQNYNHAGVATVTIPQLRKNNAPATVVFNFTAGNFSQNIDIDLDGYHWNLTQGGSGYNQINTHAEITFNNSGNGFSGSENFSVNLNLISQKFSKIFGYFDLGNILASNDSLEISLFSSGIKFGTYTFNDPRLKIKVNNATGLPLEMKINTLQGNKNGSKTPITGYTSTSKVPVSKLDSVMLIKTNSNIKTLTDNYTPFIEYNLEFNANPDGKTARNFLNAESQLTVQVITELPFNGTAVNVVMEDTMEFSLGLGKEVEYIDWINFRIGIENNLPINVGVQAYFMDSSFKVLDSLFTPFRYITKGANVDAAGNVTSAYTEQYDLNIDRAKIKNINQAKQVRIYGMMLTSEFTGSPVPVKLTQGQHFKFKMGVQSKLSVNEKF